MYDETTEVSGLSRRKMVALGAIGGLGGAAPVAGTAAEAAAAGGVRPGVTGARSILNVSVTSGEKSGGVAVCQPRLERPVRLGHPLRRRCDDLQRAPRRAAYRTGTVP